MDGSTRDVLDVYKRDVNKVVWSRGFQPRNVDFMRYTLRRAVDWILHLKPEKVGKEKVGWTRTWENVLQETPPLSSRAVRIC